jgi:DNA-binding response OmpR family regulator
MTLVLVVDDEDLVRRALVTTLERNGFSCIAACGIADAEEALRSNDPVVVMLNASLGGDSGLRLHDMLRARDRQRPAVIFVTGRRDLFGEMAERLGPGDDWIGKPWDQGELIARVRLAILRSAC